MKISIKNLKFCLAGFILLLMIFLSQKALALDPNNEMPVPYWGMPSAAWTQSGLAYKIYAEPQATEVVRNVALETLPDILFSPQCIIDKTSAEITQRCVYFDVSHYLNPTSSLTTKIMNSRTYANGYLKSATAVFVYPSINVIGDSFNADGNFSYWGRHLKQNEGSAESNALWQAGNYQFNPSAQAYWKNDDPNKNTAMTQAVDRLMQNAKTLPSSVMNVPFHGVCGNGSPTIITCPEMNQYLDGRAWYSGSAVQINNGFNYTKKSTIIIGNGTANSNLEINTSISPASPTDVDSSLGFIVRKGNVTITNNSAQPMTVRASIFVPNGTINLVGNNINLIGSFVANDFNVGG